MKILYIAPTNMTTTEQGRSQKAKREKFLNEITSYDVEVNIADNPEGPLSIQTVRDECNGIPGMIKCASELKDQYDGVITGCFGEPGLDALRELLDIPVIGCCSPAIHLANQLGKGFSVLVPVKSTIPFTKELIDKYGFGNHMVSIESLNIPVLEIRSNRELAIKKATDIAQNILKRERTDTFVLGCMSMAFQDMAKDLTVSLSVPVINPIYVAINTLEFMIRRGLSQSPQVYKL